MNTSLQNQLLENSALATQASELQQQLELKDQMISYQLIYSRNLEYEFGTIHEKLELLDQEVQSIYIPTQEGTPSLRYRFYDTVIMFLNPTLKRGNYLLLCDQTFCFTDGSDGSWKESGVCDLNMPLKHFWALSEVGGCWREAFLPWPQILHYVVTMQACLYDDVDQWLHQLLGNGRITDNSVHKFKTMQEQVGTQMHPDNHQLTNTPNNYYNNYLFIITGTRNVVVFKSNINNLCCMCIFTDQFDETDISQRPCR